MCTVGASECEKRLHAILAMIESALKVASLDEAFGPRSMAQWSKSTGSECNPSIGIN
jgi:hypothetical protein